MKLPAWGLVVGALGLVILTAIARDAFRGATFTNALSGEPLDAVGGFVACPVCRSANTIHLGGYHHVCDDCNQRYTARFDDQARVITEPPTPSRPR